MKVPHMGWNDLEIKQPGKILEGVEEWFLGLFCSLLRVKPSNQKK